MGERAYLAGPGAEYDRVAKIAEGLAVQCGLIWTQPWWERVAENRAQGWLTDADVPPEYMRENANMNRRGIDMAETVIALCKSSGGVSPGCAGEVGYSVALHHAERIESLRNKIILVGEPRGFVWSFDPAVTVVSTMAEATALLPRVPGR